MDPDDLRRAAGYREFPPPADLCDRVACTWVRRVGAASSHPQSIIPDGCVDIIAVDDGRLQVAGPATRTHLVRLAPLNIVVGIRFRPGAARAVLKCSAAELLDCNPALQEVDQRGGSVLVDDLEKAPSVTAKRQAMERWVRARTAGAGAVDASIVLAARMLFKHRHQTIDGLADQLGWSARRLQRAIRLARPTGPPSLGLAGLAREAGFADQAHMNRDFRALTGFTPPGLLASWNAEVGRWLELE
jgi:uncharacterized protein DUF6597